MTKPASSIPPKEAQLDKIGELRELIRNLYLKSQSTDSRKELTIICREFSDQFLEKERHDADCEFEDPEAY